MKGLNSLKLILALLVFTNH